MAIARCSRGVIARGPLDPPGLTLTRSAPGPTPSAALSVGHRWDDVPGPTRFGVVPYPSGMQSYCREEIPGKVG